MAPGQSRTGQSAPGQSTPGQPGQPGQGRTGTVRGTVPPAPQPTPPAPPPNSGGRSRHPGHGLVSIAPGLAGRADVRRVAALLDRYFAAVNHRAYQAYTRLFAQPGRLTPHEFTWGYSTTRDSNVVLAGLTAPARGLKATVSFTSHQDPAHSPDHSSCIDWTIALFLHRAGPAYLIGMPPRGYRAGLHACSFAPRPPAQGQARHHPARHTRSRHTRSANTGTRTRFPSTHVPGARVRSTSDGRTVRDRWSDRRRTGQRMVKSSGSIIAGCWM